MKPTEYLPLNIPHTQLSHAFYYSIVDWVQRESIAILSGRRRSPFAASRPCL